MTESGSSKNKKLFEKRIFLVPSILTAGALCAGFYSIIHTMKTLATNGDNFFPAAMAIVIAGVLDSLDGRMARLMRAETDFGVQFDSIADMVSFGVAPAVLAYGGALVDLKRLGWMGAFFFLVCAGVRLARFNVLSQEGSSRKYFKGMPSPVAAGGLSLCFLMIQADPRISSVYFQYAVLVITVLLSLLMVSNVRFRSGKDMDFNRYPIQYFLFIMFLLIMIISFQETALFFCFIVYLLWGLIEELILFRRRRKSDPQVRFLPFGDREP